MAGRYNRWLRAKLASRIEDNGGYHARRSASFALSWCVRFYGTVNEAEDAADALVECEHFVNHADLELQFPDFEQWWGRSIDGGHRKSMACYTYAQERLQDDLESDEGLRMWSRETATKYGFDYVGRGADRPFDMKLGGYGGGGKHVCLTEFEGHDLQDFCRDFADAIGNHLEGDGDTHYSNEWCRKLMGIMDELDEALTSENAARAGRYYEADWLAQELGLFD